MVLETRIEANIVAWVDKQSFNNAEKVARDTWKKINQDLKVKMELDIAKAQLKLKQLRTQLRDKDLTKAQKLTIQIETNKAQRSLTELKRKMNNLVNTWSTWVSRLQNKFDWLKWSMINAWKAAKIFVSALIARWISRAATSIVTLAGNLEQAKIAFETMLGSAEKANILLDDLSKFAATTPFELTWIRQNAKQLLAMGISAEDLLPTLKSLWDVSAWLSVPLERLALNYWQVIAQWRLTGKELRDFTVAWVPLLDELAKNLGKTKVEIQWMISAWQISADDMIASFRSMSWEWWRFADLMDKQSKTLQWAWSNLQDSLASLWETIGSLFIPALRNIVDFIWPIIEKIKLFAQENPKLAKTITTIIFALWWLVAVMWVLWVTIWPVIAWITALAWPIGVAVAWLTALIYVWSKTISAYKDMTREIRLFEDWIKDANWYLTEYWKKLQEVKRKVEDYSKKQKLANSALEKFNKIKIDTSRTRAEFEATRKAAIAEAKAVLDSARALLIKQKIARKAEVVAWWTEFWQTFNKTALEQNTKSLESEISKQLKVIDDLNNAVFTPPKIKPINTWLDKWAKDTREATKATKDYEDAVKSMSNETNKAYDELTRKIDWSRKAQEKLKDELAWIDKDIASRINEINKELNDPDTSWAEKQKLQAEKALAYKWMSEEDKAKLKAQVKEIADYEKLTQIEKLQALKAEKEAALAEEVAQEEDLLSQKEELQNQYSDFLKWKVDQEMKRAEKLRQKRLAVAAARSKAWWWSSVWARAAWWPVSAWSPYIVWERWPELMIPETNWKIIPNHNLTVNQNVNATVWDWVDIELLANELARKITLAGKWIL